MIGYETNHAWAVGALAGDSVEIALTDRIAGSHDCAAKRALHTASSRVTRVGGALLALLRPKATPHHRADGYPVQPTPFPAWAKLLVPLLVGFAADSKALPIDCWVDLFNGSDFKGKQERIYGPVGLPNLHNIRGVDWDDLIESIEVGPGAEVTVYRRENFTVPEASPNHVPELKAWDYQDENYRSGAVTFTQGRRIHHLGEYQLHRQISSLEVLCRH